MRSVKTPGLAILLSTAVLFGAGSLTSAAFAQKKGGKMAGGGASAAAGKKVYDSNGCSACHVVAGKGGKVGPDLSHAGKKGTAASLTAVIRKGAKGKVAMPAYGPDKIKDSDLKSLVAYLQSLK